MNISLQQIDHLFHNMAPHMKVLRNNSDLLVSSGFLAYILTVFNPIQCLFQQKQILSDRQKSILKPYWTLNIWGTV